MTPVTITANTNHPDVEVWRGFSIREAAGAAGPATIRFRKASISGDIVGVLELSENESATLALTKRKISTEGGVYVEVLAGTVEGVLYHT